MNIHRHTNFPHPQSRRTQISEPFVVSWYRGLALAFVLGAVKREMSQSLTPKKQNVLLLSVINLSKTKKCWRRSQRVSNHSTYLQCVEQAGTYSP